MKEIMSTNRNPWVLSFLSSVGLNVHPLSPPRLHTSPRTGGFLTRQFIPSYRIPYSPVFPFFLLLFFFTGCKPCDDPSDPECPNYCVDETNPECPNYDPCWDQTEVSAEFLMYEMPANAEDYWKVIDADTIRYALVRFEAIEKGATYLWQIGAGTYDSRVVTLNFSEFQDDNHWATLPISLTVEKAPNTVCFPEDIGRDSLIRYLTLADRCSTKLNGSYVGYWVGSSPEDTFSISVKITSDSTIGVQGWDCISWAFLTNLDREGCLYRTSSGYLGYEQMQLHHTGNYENSCRSQPSWMWLQDDSLFIDYSLRANEDGENEGDYFFKGIRK